MEGGKNNNQRIEMVTMKTRNEKIQNFTEWFVNDCLIFSLGNQNKNTLKLEFFLSPPTFTNKIAEANARSSVQSDPPPPPEISTPSDVLSDELHSSAVESSSSIRVVHSRNTKKKYF